MIKMKRFCTAASILAASFAAGLASANDSTAMTSAGGLVLTRSAEIDMVSEDLFVSVAQVRVHYVFRNRSPRDVNVTVAFPMPDRDLSQLGHQDVGYPSDFHTMVAGRPVTAALERHAVARGRDQTALLNSLHIPLAPDAEGIGHITAALTALPAARQAELRRLGLMGNDEYATETVVPMWTLATPGTGSRPSRPAAIWSSIIATAPAPARARVCSSATPPTAAPLTGARRWRQSVRTRLSSPRSTAGTGSSR
jgi:hypothetical protein